MKRLTKASLTGSGRNFRIIRRRVRIRSRQRGSSSALAGRDSRASATVPRISRRVIRIAGLPVPKLGKLRDDKQHRFNVCLTLVLSTKDLVAPYQETN
jgi:hypothetical protein